MLSYPGKLLSTFHTLNKIPIANMWNLYGAIFAYTVLEWLEIYKDDFPNSLKKRYLNLGLSSIRNYAV